MNWLKQPSTWRGILLFIGVFGIHFRPELQDAIITAIVSGVALIEVIRDEHAPTPVEIRLPPIDLIGRAGITDADRDAAVRSATPDQLRQPVQSQSETESGSANNGWNG